MNDMNDELWLKKIKERLDDCSEPLPPGGWERLQRELDKAAPAVAPRRNRQVVMRRWSVAAAASVLVAMGAVGLWLLQSPVGQEVRHAEVPAVAQPDEIPQSIPEGERLALASEAPSQAEVGERVVPIAEKASPALEATEDAQVGKNEEPVVAEPVAEEPEAGGTALSGENGEEILKSGYFAIIFKESSLISLFKISVCSKKGLTLFLGIRVTVSSINSS